MTKQEEHADEPLSPVKKALLALRDMQEKLNAVTAERKEAIAIVGIGCRFPGGATDPETYWKLLSEGFDAIREVPTERWDVDTYFDQDPATPGKMSTRWGAFLDNIDQFDASFFGIAPREATRMDPQQRLLLEVAWEALDNAGQATDQLAGSNTGTFVGMTTTDYAQLIRDPAYSRIDGYYATGNALNAAAGRLAFALGLCGPALAIDTACSSSLVAIHLACESLRNRECHLALAGGVNLLLSPEGTIAASKGRMMAMDGHCKSFDASADGYVRGEGCAVIVLKRLADAQKDGDTIWALIRGSGINQNGHGSGFTVPNGLAQQQLMRSVLQKANIEPGQLGYLETHSTGTALGDPIEFEAVQAVFGQEHTADNPLRLGSMKTNIGHLEAASGIAGLIKTVLVLRHAEIPPHLHLNELNPHITADLKSITIPTQRTPWLKTDKRRLAAVNSFGVSGTNAHILLEEVSAVEQNPGIAEQALEKRSTYILPLSARDPLALQTLVQQFLPLLDQDQSLPDICYSASVRRSHHHYRTVFVGETQEKLKEQMQAFVETEAIKQDSTSDTHPPLVFVFSGHGSQWVGMAQDLIIHNQIFTTALKECEAALQPYVDWSLLELLLTASSDEQARRRLMDDVSVLQPAIFAIQIALAALWRSWGIIPDAVVGHSMGEIAAATVAGILTLPQAAYLMCLRARLLKSVQGKGAMLLVQLPRQRVEEILDKQGITQISVAISNSYNVTALSGERSILEQLQQQWQEQQGLFCRWIKSDIAFHSPQMDLLLPKFEQGLQDLQPMTGTLPFYSTVTTERMNGNECNSSYWLRNLRQPVLFGQTVERLLEQGYTTFVEVSPHPVLLPSIEQEFDHCKVTTGTTLLSLQRGKNAYLTLYKSLGALYKQQHRVDWSQIYPQGRVVNLPRYPWQHQRYWIEAAPALPQRESSIENSHPFIGRRIRSALRDIQFETLYSPTSPAWLDDHRINWQTQAPVVVPGSSHVSLALSIAREIRKSSDPIVLTEMQFHEALVLNGDESYHVQIVLSPEEANTQKLQILSLPIDAEEGENWTLHANGSLSVGSDAQREDRSFFPPSTRHDICTRAYENLPGSTFYQDFWKSGYYLGPRLRWIEHFWRGQNEALCKMRLPQEIDDMPFYQLPPGLIDSCFQLLSMSRPEKSISELIQGDEIYVPMSVDQVIYYGGNKQGALWCHAQLRERRTTEIVDGDLYLFDEEGNAIATIIGLHVKKLDRKHLLKQQLHDAFYELIWQPQEVSPIHTGDTSLQQRWLILADEGGVGQALAQHLQTQGHECTLVYAQAYTEQLCSTAAQPDATGIELFAALLKDSLATPYQRIVHLWNLNVLTPDSKITARELEYAQVTGCLSVLYLVQALMKIVENKLPRLSIITQGVQSVSKGMITDPAVLQAPVWGFCRTLVQEFPEVNCTCIDLEAHTSIENLVNDLMQEFRLPEGETQVARRQQQRYVARLIRQRTILTSVQSHKNDRKHQALRLEISERGIVDNLELKPYERITPLADEIELRVHATGLNFRDVLNALGEYPGEARNFGGECSGVVTSVGAGVTAFCPGDEVIAIFPPLGGFSSYVTLRTDFVISKPEELSFEEAVTLPMAYFTASYGLKKCAAIATGQRVLIHAAAGGVGMAAVHIAQRMGAEIFVTAGSEEKRDYLRALGIQHVMSSRTLDFAAEILRQTEGEGVDIVLNALTGDFIPQSFRVLKSHGWFVEIGKKEILTAEQVHTLHATAHYAHFDLVQIGQDNPAEMKTMLQDLYDAVLSGAYRPLPHTTFTIQNVANAFRYMMQARHIGKIVVTQEERETKSIKNDGTYLISGGLGGLGLSVAGWLVEQGARHLVLAGRSAPTSARQIAALQTLQDAGASVMVTETDVSQEAQVVEMLTKINNSPHPLYGIIHAAGLLDDGMLLQQNRQRFLRVLQPKMDGSWFLHQHTRHLALDFFVLFSSASALLGVAGQSNYAAANAFLDALAQQRKQQNLPALSINWAAWEQVGMAAQHHADTRSRRQGMEVITLQQGRQILEGLLFSDTTQLAVLPINWLQVRNQLRGKSASSLLTHFIQEHYEGETEEPKISSLLAPSMQQRLREVPVESRKALLQAHVHDTAAKALGLDQKIDVRRPLRELGLDSLMAVDLRNMLKASLDVSLPATLLFDYPTLLDLTDYLAKDVLQLTVEEEEVVLHEPQPAEDLTEIEHLSDDEVDLLLQELADKYAPGRSNGD